MAAPLPCLVLPAGQGWAASSPPSSTQPSWAILDLQGWGQPGVNADIKTSGLEQDHLHLKTDL